MNFGWWNEANFKGNGSAIAVYFFNLNRFPLKVMVALFIYGCRNFKINASVPFYETYLIPWRKD